MVKGRCPILEFQMQNGEQLGTDPSPSLAKKKKEKGEITKKNTKSETDLTKNCWAKTRLHQARHRHTQKCIQPQGFKQKSGV